MSAMNFGQAQSRYDSMLPPDRDTSASEARDAFMAEQVRTSLDPLDRLIVQHADALKERPEATNAIILVAHSQKLRRMDDLNEWDIAISDGMYPDNARTTAVRNLCKTGADDAQLGKLIREVALEAFVQRCVDEAERQVSP
jgi:hypothetical protein